MGWGVAGKLVSQGGCVKFRAHGREERARLRSQSHGTMVLVGSNQAGRGPPSPAASADPCSRRDPSTCTRAKTMPTDDYVSGPTCAPFPAEL